MAYVSANWGEEPYLQTKNTTVTPGANWSGAETNAAEINPDSGYDAMEKVNVKVPMLRDYTLMTVSQAETPSTVYNGNTARSNSAKMLRVAPTKDGMSYMNSYLEVPASSAMGNATAADVASGKTFSSSAGIAVTGTGQMSEDLESGTIFNVTDRGSVSGDVRLKIAPPSDGAVHQSGYAYWIQKSSLMGDAATGDVLSGKYFSSGNGIYQQGTIATRSASSETISVAKTYSKGYYPNDWTVTPDGGTQKELWHYNRISKATTQITPKTTFSWDTGILLDSDITMNDVTQLVIILYDNAFVYTCIADPDVRTPSNTFYTFSRTDATAGHSKTVASFTDEMSASDNNRIAFAIKPYGYSKKLYIGYYPAYSKYSDKYDPYCYIWLHLKG